MKIYQYYGMKGYRQILAKANGPGIIIKNNKREGKFAYS
jgi:hypothetical protein